MSIQVGKIYINKYAKQFVRPLGTTLNWAENKVAYTCVMPRIKEVRFNHNKIHWLRMHPEGLEISLIKDFEESFRRATREDLPKEILSLT